MALLPKVQQEFGAWPGTPPTSPDGMFRINGPWIGTDGNTLLPSNAQFLTGYPGSDDGNVLALTVPPNVKQGAEVQSLPLGTFGYGYYEASMKVTPVPGAVVSLFTIQAPGYGPQEIDIEFLTNEAGFASSASHVHFTDHPSGMSFDQPLSFDPTAGFHRYGFLWTPGEVQFTVDGIVAHTFNDPQLVLTPGTSEYLMANTWTGNPSWGGGPPTQAATSEYDSIKYWPNATAIPSDNGGSPPPNGGGPSNGGTVGTGADKLVLNVSEDRYANGDGTSDANGDSTFVVLVDGKQIGGTLTATAMHAQGQTEQFTVLGNFGTGNHTVEVQLTNDAWSGVSTPTTDRNIYVDGATYRGAAVDYTGTDVNGDGAWFTISGGTPPPSPADDSLVLNLSADLWQGSPQFIVSVDGKQQGGPQSVTALHSAGQTQGFDFTGQFGSGQHDTAVSFVNDAYGGTPQTDRNLYVNSIDYNGQHYGSDSASMFGNGTVHFTVG